MQLTKMCGHEVSDLLALLLCLCREGKACKSSSIPGVLQGQEFLKSWRNLEATHHSVQHQYLASDDNMTTGTALAQASSLSLGAFQLNPLKS